MASEISEDPLRHHPHGTDEPTGYGNDIRVVPDGQGGPPTVYRDRPTGLNWDTLSGPARNMFAELATSDIANRFEVCVHSSLMKWAEQLKPGDPNRLPDGNPTYIQDDFIPVIKAYVNRIPQPGIAGTPIPPALPMIELEALDFLHHHQALPYQQADYANIFGELPDGFVWHPIQTLVGVRGLDHRTLVEFRAYKHFWTIHKDDPNTKQFSTKDEPTSEVSIIRPGGNLDYPQIAPGGFHNMSLPPTNHQLRKELTKVNKARKSRGEPMHPPIMYVRFANNLASIMTDHSNDAFVFDLDGIPRPKVIGSLQYEEYIDEDDFISRFTDLGRIYMNRLPTIFETSGTPPNVPQLAQSPDTTSKDSATSGKIHPKAHPKVIELTAEISGTGSLEARIDLPACECPVTVKAAQMNSALASGIVSLKKSLGNGPQRVHIPEVDCCSKATTKAPSTPNATTATNPAASAPAKVQLDPADLSAIDAKIKQLSLERINPRQLKPLSKLHGNGYNYENGSTKAASGNKPCRTGSGTPSHLTSAKIGTATKVIIAKSSIKGSETVKSSAPAVCLPPPSELVADVMIPELISMPGAPGWFFANHRNRQKLVDDLTNEKNCKEIPVIGPGAKSWITLKGEQRTNPIKLRFVNAPAIEHIKHATVISIQQTVFYYLYAGELIKKKKVAADSAHGTCFLKVYNILDAGQRLVMEHDASNFYVKTNGVAHLYDNSMNSGLVATPTEAVSIKYELTVEEQTAYRDLIVETSPFWKHPATCKCKGLTI